VTTIDIENTDDRIVTETVEEETTEYLLPCNLIQGRTCIFTEETGGGKYKVKGIIIGYNNYGDLLVECVWDDVMVGEVRATTERPELRGEKSIIAVSRARFSSRARQGIAYSTHPRFTPHESFSLFFNAYQLLRGGNHGHRKVELYTSSYHVLRFT
jgi:hypothetical protein